MGVYIKGMKMPKECLWCPFRDIGFCQLTKTDVNFNPGRRTDDCPLVEVPEPHGRLIDADKLFLDIEWHDIEEATTVIEAEEKNDWIQSF